MLSNNNSDQEQKPIRRDLKNDTSDQLVDLHKCGKGSANSCETSSCGTVDDRSNSASPTRKQPHPNAGSSFRGFGTLVGNEERIREWPPPDPQPNIFQTILRPIDLIRHPQNQNIWFLGTTANIQNLMYDAGIDLVEVNEENVNEEEASLQDRASGVQPSASEFSFNTGETTEGRQVATLRVENPERPLHLLTTSTSELRTSDAQLPAESFEEPRTERAPGVVVARSTEEVPRDEVRVELANSEPPPRPIFYVIVDTNDGGQADDEAVAQQFQFAVAQLLAQLQSSADEETPPSPEAVGEAEEETPQEQTSLES